MSLNRIVIYGVGLIGGSAAAGVRRRWPDCHITGVGRTERNMQIAVRNGLLDEIGNQTDTPQADLVLVAAPPDASLAILDFLTKSGYTGPVTDAVGYKGAFARKAESPGWRGRYIPAHPIAGTEHSGAAAAVPDLFQNQLVILCPPTGRDPQALLAVTSFWEGLGAVTTQMEAATHDKLYAEVSHLPHLLMFALAQSLFHDLTPRQMAAHTGGGLRGLLRIASSDASMWKQIFTGNRAALLTSLDALLAELQRWRTLLAHGSVPEDMAQTVEAVRTYRHLCDPDSSS